MSRSHPNATWRKSSYSLPQSDDCVEIAKMNGGCAVRDSKDSAGPILALDQDAWRDFLRRAKHGHHDLPQ